jgi:hypothetical protein
MLGNPTWDGMDTDGIFRIIVAGDETVIGQDESPAESSPRDACARNLRQLAVACLLYAGDHENDFPDSLDQWNNYLGASGEGTPAVMLCPDAKDRSVSSYRIVASGKISFTNERKLTRLTRANAG